MVFALAKNGPFARRWKHGKIAPAEVPALARMLEEEGAYAYTLETAGRLTEQALGSLRQAVAQSQTACPNDASLALEELTRTLLNRKS